LLLRSIWSYVPFILEDVVSLYVFRLPLPTLNYDGIQSGNICFLYYVRTPQGQQHRDTTQSKPVITQLNLIFLLMYIYTTHFSKAATVVPKGSLANTKP
jgi:hypothetical protein